MEIYKRKVGYEDFGRTPDLIITATTLNFPIFLNQSFEDIGIYTDVENPVFEIIDLSGIWVMPLSGGTNQKPCLTLNNCTTTITSTPISFFGASDGSLSATVSPGCPAPYSYQWTGPNGFTSPNLTITNLVSGNYTLKITDANCDVSYSSYFLQQPQGLSFSMVTSNSQTSANVGCNGSASITPNGGTPPYTFSWYSGTSNTLIVSNTTTTGLTSLCAGVYSVQIQDVNGTIVSSIFTISQPSSVSGSVVTIKNVLCYGDTDGRIILSASGGLAPTGYTFTITGPANITNTTGDFNNIPACPGTYPQSPCYTATIYDGVGNFTTLPAIAITQPNPLTLSTSPTNVTCYGSKNGVLTMSIGSGGGTPPYNLNVTLNGIGFRSLSVPSSTFLNNLDVGTYQVTLTDSNSCTLPPQVVTIKQRPKFTLNYTLPSLINGYNIACFGDDLVVPFTSLYTQDSTTDNSITSSTIRYYVNGILSAGPLVGPPALVNLSLSAGTNIITAVDSANCSATTEVILTQPAMPLTMTLGMINAEDDTCGTVTITGVPASSVVCSPCGCGNCRQAIIDINGGVHPYTITWSDGSTLLTSNSHCTGTVLTVTVTDDNGCSITSSPITLV